MSHLTKQVEQLEKLSFWKPILLYWLPKGQRHTKCYVYFEMMTERALELQRDLDVCFIDFVKAFDKVRHEPLIWHAMALDIDGQELVELHDKEFVLGPTGSSQIQRRDKASMCPWKGESDKAASCHQTEVIIHRTDHAQYQRDGGIFCWWCEHK